LKTARCIFNIFVVIIAFLAAGLPSAAAVEGVEVSLGEVKVSFLYKLSTLTGVIPFASPRLYVDDANKEVFVLSGEGVSIFNTSGMETYHADYDPELGSLLDMTVDKDGNIIVLALREGVPVITLCNYRLEPQRTIGLSKLPADFAGFHPTQLKLRDGRFYLAGNWEMKIVVTDLKGEFIRGYDLLTILGKELEDKVYMKGFEKSLEQIRADNGIEGFNLDAEGNMLFVLPVSGKACRLSPDGTAEQFGKRGSGPGKLGVPSAIARDSAGNYLVADKLRCVILVYDKEMKFITEFGSLGVRGAYMYGPNVMEMGADGKLYVGQVATRGVNVYQISGNN
jgi:hypothetical protein